MNLFWVIVQKSLLTRANWAASILFLSMGLTNWTGFQLDNPDISSLNVDNSTQVVSSAVEDFTFANGMAYWTYCAGDLFNYTTYLNAQQLNDPSTQVSLLSLNGTSCVVYRELLANPVSLFYKNETNTRIEKRDFLDINSFTTLYSYNSGNEPTALALADNYIYWSAKDQAIRRISIYGGTVQLVASTSGIPVDISIDDENIWYGTSTGVYWIKRTCTLPCSGSKIYTTNVKKLFGAGKTAPTYRAAVFWVADKGSAPDTVESYDCNVPNSSGCYHKILYEGTTNFSVDSVSGSDKTIFWIEIDTSTWTTRHLRRAPRDCTTPCPLQNIDILVSPVSPTGSWEQISMVLDDVDIYFKHLGISKIAQDADPLVWNFNYDAMEVTQGVQSLTNNVPLVIDKPTYVRVYAHLSLGDDVIGPEAQLEGTHNGTPLPGSPLQPVQRPARFSVGTTYDRGDPTTSWLFELPLSWTEQGTIVLKAIIDPRKLYDSTPPSSPLTSIPFTYRPPICLVALKVSQHGPTAQYSDPGFQLAVRTASLLLPTSGIWTYHQGTTLEEGIWPFYSPYELPDDSNKLIANIWFRDQISDDPVECAAAGARTIYTGLIHQNTNTSGVKGAAGVGFDQNWTRMPTTGNAWGVMAAGWPLVEREASLAHEIGHNFSREHVNCPIGVPNDTSPYPYENCVLSPVTGSDVYFGFDSILTKAIGPTDGSDLMSYQPPRWISDYTWKGIFNENFPFTLSPLSSPSLALASNLLLMGSVSTNDPVSGKLDHAWVLPSTGLSSGVQAKLAQNMTTAQPQVNTATRYYVRFLGLGNVVIAERDVQLYAVSDEPAASGNMSFHLVTTAPSGLVIKLQVMADNTILDTLTPGLLVPEVTVTRPLSGAEVDQTLIVGWTASDPGGDDLKFIIQFTPDLGQHWQTLATGISSDPKVTEYEASFDASALPGSRGQEAQVRVLASDGYNTTIATTETFRTAIKAPEAFISSPPEGIWYEAGQTITLEGSGTDPEDGHLAGSNLNWRLNNVNYGNGDNIQIPGLAPGAYTARLTATDSDLSQGTAEASFTIAPWKIAEGKAKLDGRCTDAAYANTPQIQLKPYSNHGQASVYAVRDSHYIWICFSGLEKGSNYNNSFVGVRMDTNFSRDAFAQSNDYAFFVRPDGSQFTKRGNSAGGYNDPAPSYVDYSLATRAGLDVGGGTWSAELRIEYIYTSMMDQIGIDVAHYWVNAQGDDYHWPYTAQYNRPNTWANNYTVETPTITSVAPDIVTLPQTLQSIVVNGTNFRNTDVILWDGAPQTTYFVNSTKVYTLMSGSSLTAGEHQVQILKGGSGQVKSNQSLVTVYNPVPVLTSLFPGSANVGSGTIGIEISGSNFLPGAVVYWDNKPINANFIDAEHIRFFVNASDLVKNGIRMVTVVNPFPTTSVSNQLHFLIGYKIYLPQLNR